MDSRYEIVYSASRGAPWKPGESLFSEECPPSRALTERISFDVFDGLNRVNDTF